MEKNAFTIVLNGMPYLEWQYKIIPKVFDNWYIIEGATRPTKDTSWCKSVPDKYFDSHKLSVDGTSEFLDHIKCDKIHVIRNNSDFWNGKVDMCNSFMDKIATPSILMEFDVDEIWTVDNLNNLLSYSEEKFNDVDGFMLKCNYFVGPGLYISNEGFYGNPWDQWSRHWHIKEKTHWLSHEPPRVKGLNYFLNRKITQEKGWVFDHYAYYLENQVKFKEDFYGYTDALSHWKRLQINKKFPCLLRDFLPWVHDNAMVDRIKLDFSK
jgi:hypothetical protein